MLRRRCKVLTRPLAGKPDMDATRAYARGCCGHGAHCNGRAASEEAGGGGYSRGLWIAIHKHMIEQRRHAGGPEPRYTDHGHGATNAPKLFADAGDLRSTQPTDAISFERAISHNLTADAPG